MQEDRIVNRAASWFGQVPQWVCEFVSEGKIMGSDFAVFCVLCIHASKMKRCFPSYVTIAKESGFSERTVQSAVKKLENVGLIRILEQGNGKGHANLYEIVDLLERVQPLLPSSPKVATIAPKVATIAVKGSNHCLPTDKVTDPVTEDIDFERNAKALDALRESLSFSKTV